LTCGTTTTTSPCLAVYGRCRNRRCLTDLAKSTALTMLALMFRSAPPAAEH
jgi:hypothetical protein